MWDPGFRTGPPGGGLEGNQGDGEGGVGMTLLFLTSPGLALSDTGKGCNRTGRCVHILLYQVLRTGIWDPQAHVVGPRVLEDVPGSRHMGVLKNR
jgi:hypothetical protein